MTHESLARKLRILRAARGISLFEAEELTGVTRETLGALEHGQRGAYTSTLEKIANGYGITVSALLAEDEPVPSGKAEAAAREAQEAAASAVARARRFRLYGEERFNRAFAAYKAALPEARETGDATQAQLYLDQASSIQVEANAVAHELALAYFRAGGEELRQELEEASKLEDKLREALLSLGRRPVMKEERDQAQRSSETAL